jgi:hypothetical protein
LGSNPSSEGAELLNFKIMKVKTYRKDFFISILGPDVFICKNAEGRPKTYEELENPKLRYLYEVDQIVLTSFGPQTIKNINYNYGSLDNHGYEWLITVRENENQYKPIEIIGIVIQQANLFQPLPSVYELINP